MVVNGDHELIGLNKRRQTDKPLRLIAVTHPLEKLSYEYLEKHLRSRPVIDYWLMHNR